MGHKGSFAGGGGKIGDDLRDGIDDWLDSLPGGPGGGDGSRGQQRPGCRRTREP